MLCCETTLYRIRVSDQESFDLGYAQSNEARKIAKLEKAEKKFRALFRDLKEATNKYEEKDMKAREGHKRKCKALKVLLKDHEDAIEGPRKLSVEKFAEIDGLKKVNANF